MNDSKDNGQGEPAPQLNSQEDASIDYGFTASFAVLAVAAIASFFITSTVGLLALTVITVLHFGAIAMMDLHPGPAAWLASMTFRRKAEDDPNGPADHPLKEKQQSHGDTVDLTEEDRKVTRFVEMLEAEKLNPKGRTH